MRPGDREERARASQELGEGFELRAFHDQVLADGALSLDVHAHRVQPNESDVEEERASGRSAASGISRYQRSRTALAMVK